MTLRLDAPAAPNLPLGPNQYERQYHDQLNNIHRLYYNRLDNGLQALFGDEGGRFLNFPYGAIQRTTDVTFTANTPVQITFDTTDYINAMTRDPGDGLIVDYEGIYNYQFSIQFSNSDSQIHDAWIWLRKNGTDMAGTGSQFSIPNSHGGVDGHVIGAANFYVELVAGDSIEMWAAANDIAIKMEAYPAQTTPFVMPSIPSAVVTLSFVSSIPG